MGVGIVGGVHSCWDGTEGTRPGMTMRYGSRSEHDRKSLIAEVPFLVSQPSKFL